MDRIPSITKETPFPWQVHEEGSYNYGEMQLMSLLVIHNSKDKNTQRLRSIFEESYLNPKPINCVNGFDMSQMKPMNLRSFSKNQFVNELQKSAYFQEKPMEVRPHQHDQFLEGIVKDLFIEIIGMVDTKD